MNKFEHLMQYLKLDYKKILAAILNLCFRNINSKINAIEKHFKKVIFQVCLFYEFLLINIA